jgi:hypothetical protein
MWVPSRDTASSCSTTWCEASKRAGVVLIRSSAPVAPSQNQSELGVRYL